MTCTELEKAPRPKRNGLPFDGCIRSEVAIVLGMEVEMVDTSEILLEPARLEPLPFFHGRRWLLLFVVVAIFAISVVVALVSCKGISSRRLRCHAAWHTNNVESPQTSFAAIICAARRKSPGSESNVDRYLFTKKALNEKRNQIPAPS